MPGLKPRAKTLHEIADGSLFLFAQRPLVPDDKAMALLDEWHRPARRLGEGA
jgi:glutamyl-tRNA synthetase